LDLSKRRLNIGFYDDKSSIKLSTLGIETKMVNLKSYILWHEIGNIYEIISKKENI